MGLPLKSASTRTNWTARPTTEALARSTPTTVGGTTWTPRVERMSWSSLSQPKCITRMSRTSSKPDMYFQTSSASTAFFRCTTVSLDRFTQERNETSHCTKSSINAPTTKQIPRPINSGCLLALIAFLTGVPCARLIGNDFYLVSSPPEREVA